MKSLSLKLKEDIFEEAEDVVKQLKVTRNAYINEALNLYNKLNHRRLLRKKVAGEVKFSRESSLEVLREMEQLDDVID